jgi:hypothetical protein
MKKVVLGVLIILGFVSFSFAAVKFGGDFITIGDFKYMSSNYVYNNRPGDPYFGLDNVEFIVNLSPKLELTSDVYGMANIIIQPTTKFKHVAIDSFMINYFHKASKLKIIPFYRYRVAKFDDPENSIGHLNSWIVASSIMGGNNVLNSKVDNTGFYIDTTSTARAGGIPYIIRPVEFMDGTVVSMPGMGEDTTNLSLVGRDMGGFYAEQRAKTYLWQVFLGAYSIDGSGGNLNLAGALNGKIYAFNLGDFMDLYVGINGDFQRFSGYSVMNLDYYNIYRYTIPDLSNFVSVYNYGGYLSGDSDLFSIFVKFNMNNQGQLLDNYVYNEALVSGGYRVSFGVFSGYFEGLKVQIGGSYSSYYTLTNTNTSLEPGLKAGRLDAYAKIFGDYEWLLGSFKWVLEGYYVDESKLNKFSGFPNMPLPPFRAFFEGAIIGKVGTEIGFTELLTLRANASYESLDISFMTNTNIVGNVSKIEARGDLLTSLGAIFEVLSGVYIDVGGRYFSWSDNLTSKGFTTSIRKKDLNLSYYSLVFGISYRPNDTTSFEVGYGYPIFGSLLDLDYGLTFDAMNNVFYSDTSNLIEGIYSEYVAQNLPRVYVDFKTKF